MEELLSMIRRRDEKSKYNIIYCRLDSIAVFIWILLTEGIVAGGNLRFTTFGYNQFLDEWKLLNAVTRSHFSVLAWILRTSELLWFSVIFMFEKFSKWVSIGFTNIMIFYYKTAWAIVVHLMFKALGFGWYQIYNNLIRDLLKVQVWRNRYSLMKSKHDERTWIPNV